jgi:hypothetical protein
MGKTSTMFGQMAYETIPSRHLKDYPMIPVEVQPLPGDADTGLDAKRGNLIRGIVMSFIQEYLSVDVSRLS